MMSQHPKRKWAYALISLFSWRTVSAETSNLRGSAVDTRIVGGHDAPAGAYPFMVKWRGCGASLIWKDILLTAAHCNNIGASDVIVGAYHDQVEGAPINSVERTIAERSPHPEWDVETLQNDFMILKLDQPVDLTPISWNKDDVYPTDYGSVTVIGFGTTETRSRTAAGLDAMFDSVELAGVKVQHEELESRGGQHMKLQEVDVEVIPTDTCNSQLMYRGFIDRDTMMCAGFQQGGKDACFGDSGGPLFTNEGGQYTQVGIVSFGAGCARENRPGVYSRISHVSDWIEEQICDLSSDPPASCFGADPPSASPSISDVPSLQPSQMPSAQPSPNPTPPLEVSGGLFGDYNLIRPNFP